MKRFRAAIEARDVDAAIACLAPDVVFRSPVVFSPYRGRDAVGAILRAVMRVFEDFRYTDELASASRAALVFTARIGDRAVDGIDLGATNADGLVSELAVFIRPMSGVMALAEAMKRELQR
jgi:limonene-1,2-epoxide hydrolase